MDERHDPAGGLRTGEANDAMHLYDPGQSVWINDPGSYGRYVDGDGRARTIASFSLAQNANRLDTRPMRVDIVRFLLGASAFGHWRREGRLVDAGADARGRATVRLSDAGLRECAASLAGAGTRPTTAGKVRAWIDRLLARPGIHGARGFNP
jgi:hypothetical protein